MSYMFQYPCGNCVKREKEEPNCTDQDKIRDGIDLIHSTTDGHHQGSGTVIIFCYQHETKKE